MLRLASRYWLRNLVRLRPYACNSCCGEVCLGGFGLGYICSLYGPMSYGRYYTLTSSQLSTCPIVRCPIHRLYNRPHPIPMLAFITHSTLTVRAAAFRLRDSISRQQRPKRPTITIYSASSSYVSTLISRR